MRLSLLNLKMTFMGTARILGTTLSFSFTVLCISVTADAYTPVDLFSINCGSSGKSSTSDGRTWTGDINSKFLSTTESQDKPSVTSKSQSQSPSINQIPYTTARISQSEFTYIFPVSAGQKFVRLFFYPASYDSFDRSNALFSVNSGGFTLLRDFNASVTADADQNEIILREYTLNVDDGQRLNLTFTPSAAHPNSYAFINGIEILSMPTNLYYTKSTDLGILYLGTTVPYSIGNKTALQMKYRLNVGGNTLPVNQDTGMFRSWENDDNYVITESALPADYSSHTPKFDQIPDYTAPIPVYRTARSMGRNGTLNKGRKLTWEFDVDSGFKYLLRLHFCELDPNITLVGDRLFVIHIAEQLADDSADILKWTHEWGASTYRDYIVNIMSGEQKFVNLSLSLGPVQEVMKTSIYDAILMGLEIFKISDGDNNLAGPNPDPLPPSLNPPKSDLPLQNQKKSSTATIGAVAGVVSAVVLISIVAVASFFIIRRAKKVKDSKSSTDGTSKWAPFSISTTKSTKSRGSSSLPADVCRYFSIAEIRAATNNFDDIFIIGVGGFGNVYKGYIDDGSTPVAIKRLKPGSQQGAHEFKTEIEMLSQLRHLHLVSLIGYCNESNEMILVYDFMARGTLRDHLYNTDNPALSWKQRLQICIGAAKGLHYLHTGAKYPIIHRDVKSTNILLDEKWVAKVSDFGLSRIGPTGISKAHVSTVVKGSVGYLDPEYYKRQRLTDKSDVYSLGVVLFEILCARPALIRTAEKKQVSLADWGRHCFHAGALSQIVDPTLKGKIAPVCLRKFGEVAVSCLLDDGSHRPSMSDVVWGLEFALQLQESAEQREQGNVGGDNVVERGGDDRDGDDVFSNNTSVGQTSGYRSSSGVSITSSSGGHSSGNDTNKYVTVFSEIMDPTAR